MRLRLALAASVCTALLAFAPASAALADGEWRPGPQAVGTSTIVGSIDAPRPGATLAAQSTLFGWVVDRSAEGWTGIVAVHVYAGEVGTGPFLGEAKIHQPRPDVFSSLGDPYWEKSGFTLPLNRAAIPAGTTRLTVYAQTPGRGWWSTSVPLAPSGGATVAPAASSSATAPVAFVPAPPPTAQQQDEFIEQVGALARRWRSEVGLPPSLVVAMAINESGWGRSQLSAQSHNYFGIKAHRGDGTAGSVELPTWEVVDGEKIYITARFRAYHSLEESVRDLGAFLRSNSRYNPVFAAASDREAAARALLAAGYATDPAWADKMIRLMNDRDLGRLDR